MANREKGEYEFEVKGKKYTICLDEDAICETEAELDLGIQEILVRLQKGANLRILRALLRAGSQGRLTREQVSAVIKDLGLGGAMLVILGAWNAAQPPDEEISTEGGSANPPEAAEAAD